VQDLLGPCLDLPLALLIEPIDIAWRIDRVGGRVNGQFPIQSETDREAIIRQAVGSAVRIDTYFATLTQLAINLSRSLCRSMPQIVSQTPVPTSAISGSADH